MVLGGPPGVPERRRSLNTLMVFEVCEGSLEVHGGACGVQGSGRVCERVGRSLGGSNGGPGAALGGLRCRTQGPKVSLAWVSAKGEHETSTCLDDSKGIL